ncbi:hypothetical protein QE152_g40763, partial [Popillia japonica]
KKNEVITLDETSAYIPYTKGRTACDNILMPVGTRKKILVASFVVEFRVLNIRKGKKIDDEEEKRLETRS